MYSFKIFEKKVVLKIKNRICETPEELLSSDLFNGILKECLHDLQARHSLLLAIFGKKEISDEDVLCLNQTFQFLTKMPAKLIPNIVKGSEIFFRDPNLFNDFVEYLYNYWRSYDRFIVCDSKGDALDQRPYRTFNETVEKLMNLVRWVYRSIEENITGLHPRIYRQVRAGAEFATIAIPKILNFPDGFYRRLDGIPVIRQILLYPPLVLNPPMNKRSGEFNKINRNPLELLQVNKEEWLCYPAKVGPLLICIYFHERFYELGFSLCNLLELANDKDLQQQPDAIYLFGVQPDALESLDVFPTVFYEDEARQILVAAVPNKNEFGYFGYLKKMVLTLHNIKIMKLGRMPFHGALVRIILKGNQDVTILIIGDTGAGKSETLEAFRVLGKDCIQDLIVIADDMGSLEIDRNGDVIGYGTETGAFLRLDDLQPGFAFGQMDRSIIMSPHKINARIILPVTTYQNVIKGNRIDFVLYANNYEGVDATHPIVERFESAEQALKVFRQGTVMSKGTTTATGLVHTYFANIFGPIQFRDLHDEIAQKYFNTLFMRKVFVGQLRTRLGIPGCETCGPHEAAEYLLNTVLANKA